MSIVNSETIKPDWMDSQKAWSGETIPRRTMQTILTNRKALLSKTTPAEKAFRKMIDKLQFHLPDNAKSLIHYHREKPFVVTSEQWFFADYYFKAFKLIVELDGKQHCYGAGKLRDEWRTGLLAAHDLVVLRFLNEEIETSPWQEIERRFLEALFSVPGKGNIKKSLSRAIGGIQRKSGLTLA